MLSNRNLNDVTPVTTSQAQTQRFQLSGRYPISISAPTPGFSSNTLPQPQPVVNNTDYQENTATNCWQKLVQNIICVDTLDISDRH
ncbi:hypothetical protein BpHYR1_010515 [Brachionus plicatilis]|uniref:Uncharacterized protein n=1 Tax=Brachionus plicatilis TaxID=10195 RepID=A0A3M7TAR1_BRAPC|nr:hypothetical protein BpHYR1_010515 [Brachionus plicatilis]